MTRNGGSCWQGAWPWRIRFRTQPHSGSRTSRGRRSSDVPIFLRSKVSWIISEEMYAALNDLTFFMSKNNIANSEYICIFALILYVWSHSWSCTYHSCMHSSCFYLYQISGWKKVYDSPTPQTEEYPEPWNSQLNNLQKAIVLRCLRPDKVT